MQSVPLQPFSLGAGGGLFLGGGEEEDVVGGVSLMSTNSPLGGGGAGGAGGGGIGMLPSVGLQSFVSPTTNFKKFMLPGGPNDPADESSTNKLNSTPQDKKGGLILIRPREKSAAPRASKPPVPQQLLQEEASKQFSEQAQEQGIKNVEKVQDAAMAAALEWHRKWTQQEETGHNNPEVFGATSPVNALHDEGSATAQDIESPQSSEEPVVEDAEPDCNGSVDDVVESDDPEPALAEDANAIADDVSEAAEVASTEAKADTEDVHLVGTEVEQSAPEPLEVRSVKAEDLAQEKAAPCEQIEVVQIALFPGQEERKEEEEDEPGPQGEETTLLCVSSIDDFIESNEDAELKEAGVFTEGLLLARSSESSPERGSTPASLSSSCWMAMIVDRSAGGGARNPSPGCSFDDNSTPTILADLRTRLMSASAAQSKASEEESNSKNSSSPASSNLKIGDFSLLDHFERDLIAPSQKSVAAPPVALHQSQQPRRESAPPATAWNSTTAPMLKHDDERLSSRPPSEVLVFNPNAPTPLPPVTPLLYQQHPSMMAPMPMPMPGFYFAGPALQWPHAHGVMPNQFAPAQGFVPAMQGFPGGPMMMAPQLMPPQGMVPQPAQALPWTGQMQQPYPVHPQPQPIGAFPQQQQYTFGPPIMSPQASAPPMWAGTQQHSQAYPSPVLSPLSPTNMSPQVSRPVAMRVVPPPNLNIRDIVDSHAAVEPQPPKSEPLRPEEENTITSAELVPRYILKEDGHGDNADACSKTSSKASRNRPISPLTFNSGLASSKKGSRKDKSRRSRGGADGQDEGNVTRPIPRRVMVPSSASAEAAVDADAQVADTVILTEAALQKARDGVLMALASTGGDTDNNPELDDHLEALTQHYESLEHDTRQHLHLEEYESACAGTWLTLTKPTFFACLGDNEKGDPLYTLGRMAFDMFAPTDLVVSLQGNFNVIETVTEEQKATLLAGGDNLTKGMTAIPKSLLDDVVAEDSGLQTYNIVCAFTIEPNSPAWKKAPNKDVRRPIRGMMTTFGHMLPDPEEPNRHSVWITGGRIEPNDNPEDISEWKRLFELHPPSQARFGLGQKAKKLACKLLMGAVMPEDCPIGENGSLEYRFTRPIGGHGVAYVDTLYVDPSLRIVRGHRGTLFVFSRLTNQQQEPDE